MQFPIPEDDAREAAIERAIAADLALRLRLAATDRAAGAAPEDTAPPLPTYGDIHRAALLGDAAARARVEAAAAHDRWVAETYRGLLARDAVALFESVSAASSGAVASRQAGGYAVEIRASSSRPGRVFLVISCAPGTAAPRRLVVHADADGRAPEPLALPGPADGVVQLVLAADHPVVAAIGDPARSFHLD
jgi:hypothetical protein